MRNVLDVYQLAVKQVLGGRELEAAVLQKAARCLRMGRDSSNGCVTDELSQALEMNAKIWTVLQSDLMDTNNPLPQSLRLNLVKLSLIVDRVTLEITAHGKLEKVEVLIDINTGIAEGLLSTASTASARPPMPQSLCA
jgi:flagellar protein FlaF